MRFWGRMLFVASLIMLGHGYAKERGDTDNQRWARRQLPNQATKNLVDRDRGKFVGRESFFVAPPVPAILSNVK